MREVSACQMATGRNLFILLQRGVIPELCRGISEFLFKSPGEIGAAGETDDLTDLLDAQIAGEQQMFCTVKTDTCQILVRSAAVDLLESPDKIIDGQVAALGKILYGQIFAVELVNVTGDFDHAQIGVLLRQGD